MQGEKLEKKPKTKIAIANKTADLPAQRGVRTKEAAWISSHTKEEGGGGNSPEGKNQHRRGSEKAYLEEQSAVGDAEAVLTPE